MLLLLLLLISLMMILFMNLLWTSHSRAQQRLAAGWLGSLCCALSLLTVLFGATSMSVVEAGLRFRQGREVWSNLAAVVRSCKPFKGCMLQQAAACRRML
jgi:hypothetical protein